MTGRTDSRAGFAELAACGLIWGSIGVITRRLAAGAPAIAFFRLAVGSAAVVAFFAARGRLSQLRLRDQRLLLFADGAILGVHWLFMFEAFKRLSVASAILIVFLGPVMVAAGVGRLLDEPLERRTIASLALSVAGIAMIAVPAWRAQNAAGVLDALVSAVTFAALMIANKRLTRSYTPPVILTWQLGIAAVAVAPVFAASGAAGVGRSLPGLLTLAVVHTSLTGLVYFRALTDVKAQHAGVLAYLEPVSGVVYAWIVLHEHPSVLTLAGGALVVLAGLNIVVRRPVPALGEPVAAPADVEASLQP